MTDATLTELNRRIAAIRENIRDLIEQAAAYSGAADDQRTAERIADQEAQLAKLLKKRDALVGNRPILESTVIRGCRLRSAPIVEELSRQLKGWAIRSQQFDCGRSAGF